MSQDRLEPLSAAASPETAHDGAARRVSAVGGVSADEPLRPLAIERREPGARDVVIEIEYCGLCHSDVHMVRGEWREVEYPLVPGHEIVGRVSEVGADVTAFGIGDRVGVGCLVDSCRTCEACRDGLEQFCSGNEQGAGVGTYGSVDYRNGGGRTQGGYSQAIVVDADYVLRVPTSLDAASAAPLLCAGITTYAPLRRAGVGEGTRVGVVGLGGLGHMAVKLAKAMGASVTVFSRTDSKADDAGLLGADHFVVSSDPDAMAAARQSLDVVIDTVAAPHELDPYLATIARDGRLVQVGLPADPMPPVNPRILAAQRVSYTGSFIGGIAETQEMLDFCAEHGVSAQIEMIGADEINEAYERMVAGDVAYRFVLDIATLPEPESLEAGAGARLS
ncbi:NAD(P)-dependent alcohol dehydrogenase [Falsarthrobacter nasiphocae]|uniref:alcohol dehydrogenase (NADP(+)) n=1 Tax=Falsarthrobacter nasiphocae TaxID=189863 RepID=A0AAE4C8T8_9MICC|nr:NAD(P)-dependent alcohol dehydrogenase [Falsarthrobacter nasiphocae]MDR6892750.1 putative zinc-type alcohol dehydrogenase-like protein [Falsarthrobacter nasiphocae]